MHLTRRALRAPSAVLALALAAAPIACGDEADDADEGGDLSASGGDDGDEGGDDDDDEGAAPAGLSVEIDGLPRVEIDDEFGTEVTLVLELDHRGGAAVDALTIVSAGLSLDLEPFAALPLAQPEDHPPFDGIAADESQRVTLRGRTPDTHDDWGICTTGHDEDEHEDRVTLDLVLEAGPGGTRYEFPSLAVALGCVFVG